MYKMTEKKELEIPQQAVGEESNSSPKGRLKIPHPREGKKFLTQGRSPRVRNFFFLPEDEEFFTFPRVRNLILSQLPVEETDSHYFY